MRWRRKEFVRKAFSIPTRSIATTGRGVLLTASVLRYTMVDGVTLRLPFGETVVQAWTLFKVTAVPTLLMAIPFGAVISVQAGGLVNQLGATSLLGAASGLGVIKQGAPICAGLLMGGAAASAIASDLGARAIREELDALRVMGVDPVRHLVIPPLPRVDYDRADLVRDHHRRGGRCGVLSRRGGKRCDQRLLLDVVWILREGGRRLLHHWQSNVVRRDGGDHFLPSRYGSQRWPTRSR